MNRLKNISIIFALCVYYSLGITRARACSALPLPNAVLPDMSKYIHRKRANTTAIHEIELLSEFARIKDPEFKRFLQRHLSPPFVILRNVSTSFKKKKQSEPQRIPQEMKPSISFASKNPLNSSHKHDELIQELVNALKSVKKGTLKGKVIRIRKIYSGNKEKKTNEQHSDIHECFNEGRIYGDPEGKSFYDNSITFTLPMNQSDAIFCLNYCNYPCQLINFNRQNNICSLISRPMALNTKIYRERISLHIKCSIHKSDMKPKALKCFFPGHQIAGGFTPSSSREVIDSIHCQIECRKEPQCTHFTYNDMNGKCFLLKNVSAHVVNPKFISGYKTCG